MFQSLMTKVTQKIKHFISTTTCRSLLFLCALIPRRNIGQVLFWTDSGMYALSQLHAILGFCLKMRGVAPHFILCDGIMRGGCFRQCIHEEERALLSEDWDKTCSTCLATRERLFRYYSLSFSHISEYLTQKDISEANSFALSVEVIANERRLDTLGSISFHNIPIGLDIRDTLVRYAKSTNLFGIPTNKAYLFSYSAALTCLASEQAFKRYREALLFIPHPQYASAGPTARAAHNIKKPFCHYSANHTCNGIVYKTIFPSDLSISAFSVSDDAWEEECSRPFTQQEEQQINAFLWERYTKQSHHDMLSMPMPTTGNDMTAFMLRQGIRTDKPIYAVFTHITFDNSFGYGNPPFDSFDHWLDFTIRTVWGITDVQWLVKIHPAEYYSEAERSESGALAYLQQHFPNLPEHIKIILPDSQINTLDFIDILDGMISCCGTSGLEAAIYGKKVINGCHGYYSGKGFTYDAADQQTYAHYLKNIKQLPMPTPEQIVLAKRFVHLFFLRRGIPVPAHSFSNWNFELKNPFDILRLLPGRDSYADLICDGIMQKKDIILPEARS
ncbi:Capsule polysaccharide biosynthesis protein [Desulfocurvibacter africanus PCS]|uniref:Capsule polysaccharide biosynthesis protein n=1 Tax=Desulfocurvibacter africanus PCS TaxID=1262666 RepID=M5PWI7_DESAF|nr:hypothetical protein [Desulfocurvibacter africanus]EMG38414.1 Capsule polysaccharide biosynthesis protein [Desulfocurvibacter africanus PCS]